MSCIIYLGRRSIPVIYLWLLLVGQVAIAEQIMLVTPPRDIALKEPESPPPPGGPFTYATTGDKPNWYIQAWNIPAGKLSAFVERKERSNTVFSSSAPEAGVQIVKLPDGRTSYRLSQDGTVLPCSHQGEPLESNLLAGPNALHARPPEWSSMTLRRDDMLPIAQLVHLVASATVAIRFAPTVLRKGCAVSQAAALISVVLNNRTAHQTLFYQVALSFGCGPQPEARQRLCETLTNHPRASYYFRTNPFGVADVLPLFGQNWLPNDERHTLHLDLLPHLLRLIESGPSAMDHDSSHWTVDGYYNGQHIWGDVTMTSEWDDVGLIATTR